MPEEQQDMKTQVAVLASKMDQLTLDVRELRNLLTKNAENFVTKAEFLFYKNLINGTVSVVLIAFVGGLVALVWKA